MVIIDTVINTLLGRVTRHPAGMHCPWWDDAFVSSLFCNADAYIANMCAREKNFENIRN